ncbi:hypothetical protein HDU82_005125 [Entophlyctis luteolus]|nr:hypothetical protein HDU82_005125 [Entophlyctis luteolus]
MSACTVISYLPIGIALLASLAFEDGLRAYPLWLIVCASELVLLDTVWSPLMLLVFMPRVRRCLFRMLRILDHDANETNSSTDEEEDEREAIELSIPG